jgi:hypothetical protein
VVAAVLDRRPCALEQREVGSEAERGHVHCGERSARLAVEQSVRSVLGPTAIALTRILNRDWYRRRTLTRSRPNTGFHLPAGDESRGARQAETAIGGNGLPRCVAANAQRETRGRLSDEWCNGGSTTSVFDVLGAQQ